MKKYLLLLLILSISGCATTRIPSVASKYESKLSLGLTKNEVKTRLGEPTRISSHLKFDKENEEYYEVSHWIYFFSTFWKWPHTTEQLYITFTDNKVIGWGPSPGLTPGLTTKADVKKEIIIKER